MNPLYRMYTAFSRYWDTMVPAKPKYGNYHLRGKNGRWRKLGCPVLLIILFASLVGCDPRSYIHCLHVKRSTNLNTGTSELGLYEWDNNEIIGSGFWTGLTKHQEDSIITVNQKRCNCTILK